MFTGISRVSGVGFCLLQSDRDGAFAIRDISILAAELAGRSDVRVPFCRILSVPVEAVGVAQKAPSQSLADVFVPLLRRPREEPARRHQLSGKSMEGLALLTS